MKYAVEARIFDDGKTTAKVRPEGCKETGSYGVWVHIFDTKEEAQSFCDGYHA